MNYLIDNNKIKEKINSGKSINPERILNLLQSEIHEVVENYFYMQNPPQIRYKKTHTGLSFTVTFDVEELKNMFFL